jgi:hypothetical protein
LSTDKYKKGSTMAIREARELNNPHITYTEKKKTKKGLDLDRIIAVLSGIESGKFTRVANKYRQIDRLEKLCKRKRDELNSLVKGKFQDLFDVQDEIYTRVIESVSLVATLAKKTDPKTEYEDFDEVGYTQELEVLLGKLGESLENLQAKYTKILPIVDPESPSPKLTVKLKEDLSNMTEIVYWCHVYQQKVKAWLVSWDSEFNRLKAEIEEHNEDQ